MINPSSEYSGKINNVSLARKALSHVADDIVCTEYIFVYNKCAAHLLYLAGFRHKSVVDLVLQCNQSIIYQ